MREQLNSKKGIQRTLQRAVDLTSLSTITSDELLACTADAYQHIRRAATRARNQKLDHFVCAECGHAVYAPREPRTRLPYWRHHKGALPNCRWWTGDPRSVDQVSARQFDGAQESALHRRIKHEIAALLEVDPLTSNGSIIVDEYLSGQNGHRRPDVRAVWRQQKIAFEVQLATTQIPVIDARESFYAREGYHLIWLTWNFTPVARSELRTAFEDIFYSHNKNLFSLDDESVKASREARVFHLRAFWENNNNSWDSSLFSLAALTWPSSGLPYACVPRPPWNKDFLARWLAVTTDCGTPWPARSELLEELAIKFDLGEGGGRTLDEADISALINCLLSFQAGRPVGSRQRNLIEVANTFLSSAPRQRFARILRKAAHVTQGEAFLDLRSVSSKLDNAYKTVQYTHNSNFGKIVLQLFPDLLSTNAVRAISSK